MLQSGSGSGSSRAALEGRARARYFQELQLARAEAGCAADHLSPDENYPGMSRIPQYQLLAASALLCNNLTWSH